MKREIKLLIKSTVWEILSAILGFTIVYLFTGELGITINITVILLVLKSVLLAIYDHYTSKFIDN